MTPGDLEAETAAGRRRQGVPLEEDDWGFFASLAG